MRALIAIAVALVTSGGQANAVENYIAKNEKTFSKIFGVTSRRTWNAEGTVLLTLSGRTTPVTNAYNSAESVRAALARWIGVDVRANEKRRRIARSDSHYEFTQFVGGQPVENAVLIVDVAATNEIVGITNQTFPGLEMMTPTPRLPAAAAKCFAAARFLERAANCDADPPRNPPIPEGMTLETPAAPILFAVPPLARWAWPVELTSTSPRAVRQYVVDATHGFILEIRDRVHHATPHGRIFNPNPFTDPGVTGFADVTLKTPPYENVKLERLKQPSAGQPIRLVSDFVEISDFQPHQCINDDITSPDGNFDFERGTSGFASVMAYYYIDQMQQYVRKLGFTNIPGHAVSVDIRSEPFCFESEYTNKPVGAGPLTFGFRFDFGKVFQAEDGDVIAHEYGHALQTAQAGDRYDGGTAETGAISEGWADYWAMTCLADAKSRGSRPLECFGEWVKRSIGDATGCLRTINLTATKDNFDPNKEDHDNGTVWTATLWEIRKKLTKEPADNIILRSHLSVIDHPDFTAAAKAILDADNALNTGHTHTTDLCDVFRNRKILVPQCP